VEFYEYDITEAVEEYEGKELTEIFHNHKIKTNEMGSFLNIYWQEKLSFRSNLVSTKRKLLKNLKAVQNIGVKTENYLKKRGINNLLDLIYHCGYQRNAMEVINQIKEKNFQLLEKNFYIKDIDLLFCFRLEDLLFLDIESTGVYGSSVFLIGLGYFKDGVFKVKQYLARTLEDELAIFERLKDFLKKFKCFITYNGKTFDIPVIADRFLYYFEENPLISEDDNPYEVSNTLYHHIDLYHNCRRLWKDRFDDYRLSTIEKQLLQIHRDNDIPGAFVGFFYKRYVEKPKKYAGLIRKCIMHNYDDVRNLPFILDKLLENLS
jgi:uncharacterized protein YprB with RNaseH-like and TPR domain